MEWSEEAEQGLPPQRHKEPGALRRDIRDELADHLALASERELEAGVQDEGKIRASVLEKFGDPKAVARTLWWDAMKEVIVKDWIQIAINAVICIAVIGFMALFYGQMQTTNTALLNALNERPSAVGDEYPSVEFILHRGSVDGPAAEGIKVDLLGKAFTEDSAIISENSDSQGSARFGPIRAGRYLVILQDEETGLRNTQGITLYVGDGTKTFHVLVPPTEPVALDVMTGFNKLFTSEERRIVMLMEASWSHEGDLWQTRPSSAKVIATLDGIFSADTEVRNENTFELGKKITNIYGNRISFNEMGVAVRIRGSEDGKEFFGRLRGERNEGNYKNFSISHNLHPNEANTIALDLPSELLEAYNFYARLSANRNHGLPERLSWFVGVVTREYPDFVIHEGSRVEESFFYHWSGENATVILNQTNLQITDQSAGVYSLKNAPKTLPEGYKLLLAFQTFAGRLDNLDVSLRAYLDSTPGSHVRRARIEYDPLKFSESIWSVDTKSITSQGSFLVDLTGTINDDPNLGDAHGVLFKWETPSTNLLSLPTPERADADFQAVWLVLKPIAEDSASSATDV